MPEIGEILRRKNVIARLTDAECQTRKLLTVGRISEPIHDGFVLSGAYALGENEGQPHSDIGEGVVVNRAADVKLATLIKEVKLLQEPKASTSELAVSLAQIVAKRMSNHSRKDSFAIYFDYQSPYFKQEIAIGEITSENGFHGVCRHKSLLFQTLAPEVNIESTLVLGYHNETCHMWNEIIIDNQPHLFDVSHGTLLVPLTSQHELLEEYKNINGNKMYPFNSSPGI